MTIAMGIPVFTLGLRLRLVVLSLELLLVVALSTVIVDVSASAGIIPTFDNVVELQTKSVRKNGDHRGRSSCL